VKRAWTWWLAWGLLALVLVLALATLVVDALTTDPSETGESDVGTVTLVLSFLAFAVVGALVASRQPRNAVGWLFLATPVFAFGGAFAEEYAFRAIIASPGEPAGIVAAWFYGWMWFPALGSIMLVPLLFPDGKPPGPRWRWLLWVSVTLLALTTIGAAVSPGEIDSSWPGTHEKPLTIDGLEGFLDAAQDPGGLAFVILLLCLLASVVVRFRRSRGDERQQMKWMLVAVALLIAQIFVEEALGDRTPDAVSGLVFAMAVASIPVAAGVAMLKYRLYDVDVVIRKTLVYGSLTVLLALAYAGLVLGGQAVFSSFAGGSNLAIAVSTLVVAALFLPVRSRVQRVVERRFYRRRYDAERTLEAFGARLREQVELDALRGDLEGVVRDTMQPAHVSLWLREAGLRYQGEP
jgi:hypothetical protein